MVIFSIWNIVIVILASITLYRQVSYRKALPHLAMIVLLLEIFISTCRFTYTVYDPYLLGRYSFWLVNLAGTYGQSFAAVSAIIIAIWWLKVWD